MSINKALLIGHLGHDLELKTLEGGRMVTNFRMATNETWKDKEGARQKRTEWHRIVAWGNSAQSAHRCLSKGSQVCVEGRIQTRKWTDKEGADRYTTEVVAHHITFLDRKDRGRDDSPAPPVEIESVPY